MKLLYSILALSLLFFSCSKEENSDFKTDYSVLGISYVEINGLQIPVKNSYLLDVSNQNSMGITGTYYTNPGGAAGVECVVKTPLAENKGTVTVNSKYPDVAIVVKETSILNGKKVSVNVSRIGYKQNVTYTITFLSL